MTNDLLYQLCLCDIPYIGNIQAKILAEAFPSARAIFEASIKSLERIEGIGEIRARNIKSFREFDKAEKEIRFIEKYGITPLFITDHHYPQRLLNCYDPPVLLFYKGNTTLNYSKIISVVGTRRNTEYGKVVVDRLMKYLAPYDILVISGLAFGIDTLAHKYALKNKLPTVGVVAHGLDTIYPVENTNLAKEMLGNGGLLTEFKSNTKPNKHHFPSRNRIVAGVSDATIVIESGSRGGSMITAEIASGYNKEVFAVPGRITDIKSGGCNELIHCNRAILLNSPQQLLDTLGWTESQNKLKPFQTESFIDLNTDEQSIITALTPYPSISVDQLLASTRINNGTLLATLIQLEMKGFVQLLPGNMYSLVTT